MTWNKSEVWRLGWPDRDLVRIEMDRFGKPESMRRIPLRQVKLVKHTEGLLTDQAVLDIGEPTPVAFQITRLVRYGTREFVRLLSG